MLVEPCGVGVELAELEAYASRVTVDATEVEVVGVGSNINRSTVDEMVEPRVLLNGRSNMVVSATEVQIGSYHELGTELESVSALEVIVELLVKLAVLGLMTPIPVIPIIVIVGNGAGTVVGKLILSTNRQTIEECIAQAYTHLPRGANIIVVVEVVAARLHLSVAISVRAQQQVVAIGKSVKGGVASVTPILKLLS